MKRRPPKVEIQAFGKSKDGPVQVSGALTATSPIHAFQIIRCKIDSRWRKFRVVTIEYFSDSLSEDVGCFVAVDANWES